MKVSVIKELKNIKIGEKASKTFSPKNIFVNNHFDQEQEPVLESTTC
ncbi:hypothetical protein [Enterococcus cecorum]|nr:hypothetical protein [Enterococcus cecorum]